MRLAKIRPAAPGDAVVVTGASTGMGEDAARYLNGLGYRVFAGVRKDADGTRVHDQAPRPDDLHPVRLDITDREQIAAAVETVRSLLPDGRGVRGALQQRGRGQLRR